MPGFADKRPIAGIHIQYMYIIYCCLDKHSEPSLALFTHTNQSLLAQTQLDSVLETECTHASAPET